MVNHQLTRGTGNLLAKTDDDGFRGELAWFARLGSIRRVRSHNISLPPHSSICCQGKCFCPNTRTHTDDTQSTLDCSKHRCITRVVLTSPLIETSIRFRWFREHGIDTADRLVAWASVPKDELEIKIGEINSVRDSFGPLVVTHAVRPRQGDVLRHHTMLINRVPLSLPLRVFFAGVARASSHDRTPLSFLFQWYRFRWTNSNGIKFKLTVFKLCQCGQRMMWSPYDHGHLHVPTTPIYRIDTDTGISTGCADKRVRAWSSFPVVHHKGCRED